MGHGVQVTRQAGQKKVSEPVLLPIGRQYRGQRRGIGRWQGGLSGRRRRKRRHRVDQVLHLAVEQRLANR